MLDVGCHNGLLLSLLSEGIEKHGVDLLKEPQLQENGIKYKKYDVSTGLPYADATFDVVNSSEVIEHLMDTASFLQECYRVLKPGGRIVISTPNLHYWRNIIKWLKGNQFFFVDYHKHQEGHIRYFCSKTLRELAGKVGFQSMLRIISLAVGLKDREPLQGMLKQSMLGGLMNAWMGGLKTVMQRRTARDMP